MAERGEKPETPPRDWKRIHLWQIQPVRDLLLIAAVLGIVQLGYAVRVVTVPMLLAVLLAYLVEPIVAWASRTGRMGRPAAALSLIILTTGVIVVPAVLGIMYGTAQAVAFAQDIAADVQVVVRSVDDPDNAALDSKIKSKTWREIRDYLVRQEQTWKAHEAWITRGASHVDSTAEPTTAPEIEPAVEHEAEPTKPSPEYALVREGVLWARDNVQKIGQSALRTSAGAVGMIVRGFGSIAAFVFGAFLTGFFFYFFSTGYGRLLIFWRKLIPQKKKSRVIDLLTQMDAVIAGFVRGRLTVCACMILVYTVGYWIVGVPAPMIVGPLIGVLTLAPYVSGVGVPLAVALMLLSDLSGVRAEWWWVLGGPTVVFLIAQGLDDYVLTPIIQGRNTNMDTPTILFASIAGGALAGVYGVLVAVPVAACLKILLSEVLMPRVRAWAAGQAEDPLPLGG